jgi:hypothetical protein
VSPQDPTIRCADHERADHWPRAAALRAPLVVYRPPRGLIVVYRPPEPNPVLVVPPGGQLPDLRTFPGFAAGRLAVPAPGGVIPAPQGTIHAIGGPPRTV